MAGIFQPFSDKICKEISLVQGYCCYSKIKNNNKEGYACIRTKKLLKNKNEATEEMKKYINFFNEKNNAQYEIVSIDCGKSYVKYKWIFIYIFIILF